MSKPKQKPVTEQPEAGAKETMADVARNADVMSMIDRVRSMSEVLAEIAVEQQYSKPEVAAKAAMGAARAASEVISGLVIKEQMADLDRQAKEALEQAGKAPPPNHFKRPKNDVIGLCSVSKVPVKLPSWGYPIGHETEGDDQDETQIDTGSKGDGEPGSDGIPNW